MRLTDILKFVEEYKHEEYFFNRITVLFIYDCSQFCQEKPAASISCEIARKGYREFFPMKK